jgi:hypothetical protein
VSRLRALLARLWPFGDSGSDDDRDGTVWDVIPSRQYGGRHAESGGIARDEQERAIRDIERRAAAEEEFERRE